MLWIYKRRNEDCRVETSYDRATSEYLLKITRAPGDTQQVERFATVASFQQRLEALEHQLAQEQWEPTGPAILLKDGWKL